MLRLGEVCIELFEFKSPTPATKPNDYPASDHGISHFCFIVEDLNAEYTRLSATGMRFHSQPKLFNGAWSVYARDPDGNIIELIEMGGGDDHTIEAAAHLL
jgi:catechol 2,3-dioxygenase-like lactoylglutathione lyase family enzyme